MDFVVIDVETANADVASICQVGIASYDSGVLVDEWKTYVDPEDFFDFFNVCIHGITEETVAGSPTLPVVAESMLARLQGTVVVSHTHFERLSLHRGFERYDLRLPELMWLDSARVARRTWIQFARSGYALHNLCDHIGYEYPAHDALEDAKAAGQVILTAINETGLSVQDWLSRVKQPIDPSASRAVKVITREGDPEGPLFGEVLVFTGALQVPRRVAADLAADAGCEVDAGVTKNTSILVVGDQDVLRLAGHDKSSKHRKAESLVEKGQHIRILRESDFMQLCSDYGQRSASA